MKVAAAVVSAGMAAAAAEGWAEVEGNSAKWPVQGDPADGLGRCAGLADVARARCGVEGEARVSRRIESCKGRLQAARLVEARGAAVGSEIEVA